MGLPATQDVRQDPVVRRGRVVSRKLLLGRKARQGRRRQAVRIPLLRLLSLLAVTLSVATASAGELVGRASVIDGDTVEIHGERIRLNGIDAPESRQLCQDAKGRDYRCGQAAALALDDYLAANRPTRCVEVQRDRYKRMVAHCYRADGSDVAAWLVLQGHALDWPRYSKGRYAEDQATAERDGAGVWQGRFVKPWEWRKGAR